MLFFLRKIIAELAVIYIIKAHFFIRASKITQVYFSKSYLSKFTRSAATPARLK